MRLAYEAEPRLIALSFGMALLEAVPDSLYAVWLMLLADGFAQGDQGTILAGCLGLAGSGVASWLLQTQASRIQRTFRMRVGATLEGHVAGLQARVPTIEHQERPDYLDRLSVLKEQTYQLDHMYLALFGMLGSAVAPCDHARAGDVRTPGHGPAAGLRAPDGVGVGAPVRGVAAGL